jgi:hypothetical protein
MVMGFMLGLLLIAEALGGDVCYVRDVNRLIASGVGGRTTFLSQKLLEYAALGEATEPVHNVIETIASGTQEEVEEAAVKLLAVGHCSGTDTLLGILLGSRVGIDMAPPMDRKPAGWSRY